MFDLNYIELFKNIPPEIAVFLISMIPIAELRASIPIGLTIYKLDVKITAKSAIAVDAKTGTILYKNNSQEIRSMASITKLMTALVFLDHNPGWQKEIFTIASDRRNGGIIHLNTGEVMTLKDLFYTALIASDNDAAMALARSTGLSESEFINKMNQKAKQIGLTDTQFSDPTGLKFSNKSTAQEIIKLLNYALQDSVIKDATSTAKYEFEVMGNGIATNKIRASEPYLAYLPSNFIAVLSNSQVKNLLKILKCFIKNLEIGSIKYKIKNIGMILPKTA